MAVSELDAAIAEVDAAEAAIRKLEAEKFARVSAAAQKEVGLAQELATAPDAEELAKRAREAAGTPAGFAQTVLGLGMYQWQSDVLTWFEDTSELVKASLCTPNGAGKSAYIVAALALWWISVHPQGMVVITTKDSKQLDNQIWPAIERHKGKFASYDFIERMVRNGTGGFIIGFTTDDPGRAEGWHKLNDFSGPLLIIGDEAKSIIDPIHMALDRCTYNAKLLTSSPGLTEGLFWKSQSSLASERYNAKGYVGPGGSPANGFRAMKVGLVDCPHIPKSRIDNIVATYGPDHWFTRSTLHAEFTDADSDTLFIVPKHVMRGAMDSPPAYVHGGKRVFCDFAAGGAENVFSLKVGNRITQVCWRDPDPMRAVARFVALFVEHGLRPSEIYADAGGMGIAILARFRELGWPIQGVNNESRALDPARYPSLGAEMWHNGAVELARGKYIIPNDEILFEQATGRRAVPTSDGILGIESKRDMQRRGVVSPDRADGLFGVIATDNELANTLFDGGGLEALESVARTARPEVGALDLVGDVVRYEAGAPGAWLEVFEKPIVGRRYLLVVNPLKHDEPLESHTVMVLRSGYVSDDGDEVKLKLAAKVLKPLRLDAGPLGQLLANLSGWYGRCMIVVITNDRGDLIEELRARGLPQYCRRPTSETVKHGPNERLRYGWLTDGYTRSKWIGALAEAIREKSIDVQDIETVLQFYSLSADNAAQKRDAEAFGVGLVLQNYSSTYAAPQSREMFGRSSTMRGAIVSSAMIS